MYSYMRYDSRLSGVLHVLLHMAEWTGDDRLAGLRPDREITSEMLAKTMGTNPVVIRRIMAGLREQGYVRSDKGHGGGWTLACDLSKVTLRDVYAAFGCPSLLAIGHRTQRPAMPRRAGGECRRSTGPSAMPKRCCWRGSAMSRWPR